MQIASKPVPARFSDLEQQSETSLAGMWLFLATELIFFGALFLAYIVYRYQYPHAFSYFSHQLNFKLGTINTALLLTSSLSMAIAVRAVEKGERKKLIASLLTTFVLGSLFLVVKLSEWHEESIKGFVPGSLYTYRGAHAVEGELFFSLYFYMTGLHGLHILIGLAIMLIFMCLALFKSDVRHDATRIEVLGLYWHFVDIIWIFLYPCLYLVV